MKVGVMQPYFFPYIGYFQLIHSVDLFILLDDVNYIKKGWINRNRLLINGQPKWFTLPLVQASQNRSIRSIRILNNPWWKKKLLRSIFLSYRSAPHFGTIFPLIEKCLHNQTLDLVPYIQNTIEQITNYLEISVRWRLASLVDQEKKYKGQERILELCRISGAETYINAIGGQELYQKEAFDKFGIELCFIKTKQITYKQFNDAFEPNLSIIDLLMFNSREGVIELLDDFEVINP